MKKGLQKMKTRKGAFGKPPSEWAGITICANKFI